MKGLFLLGLLYSGNAFSYGRGGGCGSDELCAATGWIALLAVAFFTVGWIYIRITEGGIKQLFDSSVIFAISAVIVIPISLGLIAKLLKTYYGEDNKFLIALLFIPFFLIIRYWGKRPEKPKN